MPIDDLMSGWAAMSAALPQYQLAQEQYEGCVPEAFASERIRQLIKNTAEEYKFDVIKTVISALVHRVRVSSVTVPGDDVQTGEIAQIWAANDMDVYMPMVLKLASIYGDAYTMEWPTEFEFRALGEAGVEPDLVAAGVEITVQNPMNCRMFYDPENERRKLFLIKRWPMVNGLSQKYWRADVHYGSGIERYVSSPGQDPAQVTSWGPYLEEDQTEDVWLVDQPSGEIPFQHFRNDLPYGNPEHLDGYGCQNAINKMLITQILTTEAHGWPQRWQLTQDGSELDNAGDTPDWTDDAYAPENGVFATRAGQPSQERVGPGTTSVYSGIKAVGEWAAADPDNFLKPADTYLRLMSQITITPMRYFNPVGEPPSGEALKTEDFPFAAKCHDRTVIYTAPLREMWAYILTLRGIFPGSVAVQWAPVEVAVGLDDWMVIQAKQKAGVPMDQTLVEGGYPAEQVARWMNNDAEQMDLATRMGLMVELGTALTGIATAVTAGAVDPVLVTSVVDRLLNQTVPMTNPDIA